MPINIKPAFDKYSPFSTYNITKKTQTKYYFFYSKILFYSLTNLLPYCTKRQNQHILSEILDFQRTN